MNKTSSTQAWPVQVFRHSAEKGWETTVDHEGNDVMAKPFCGGIEIPRFRVRIRLFSPQENGNYGYASRRCDRIYCPSRSSSGAIVLKFQSKQDCIEFYDQLVALNPQESDSTVNSNGEAASNSDEENDKRRPHPSLDLTRYGDESSVKRRKYETMSYIVRLLHNDEFHKFVDNVEATLLSTQDGASILAAMKRSSSNNNTASTGIQEE